MTSHNNHYYLGVIATSTSNHWNTHLFAKWHANPSPVLKKQAAVNTQLLFGCIGFQRRLYVAMPGVAKFIIYHHECYYWHPTALQTNQYMQRYVKELAFSPLFNGTAYVQGCGGHDFWPPASSTTLGSS